MAAESLPAKAQRVSAEHGRAETQKNRVGKHYRLWSATSVDPRFGFYEDITMASGGKLRKAVATIGLCRPLRSAVLFQKSSPMRVLLSYSSCSQAFLKRNR